ncbi:MAG TPA: hypothetical protein GXX29_00830 [Firmicutes bacterium]|nr:hypothetical protein [Bacillota bacterium]
MSLPPKAQVANVKWHHDPSGGEGIPTCHLHSYTKAALTALQTQEGSVDPVWVAGASGAAFRIWIHKDICPSATSVFNWSILPAGIVNAGWNCRYHSRLWHEEFVAEERRLAALEAIKAAINEGKTPICWDVDIPEWGVITGYDDAAGELSAVSVISPETKLKYEQLGKRNIPIMSVTIIDGRNGKERQDSILNSLHTAVKHAEQGEWNDRPAYQDGLPAYEQWENALLRLAETGEKQNMLYYLCATYTAARHYAGRYLELIAGEMDAAGKGEELAAAAGYYRQVEEALKEACAIFTGKNGQHEAAELKAAARLVKEAGGAEAKAIGHIKNFLK